METKIVSYDEARKFVTDGDIVFVEGNSVIGKLIRVATRSHYSHVGIAFWAEIGSARRLMLLEAQGNTKRRIVNLSMYSTKKLVVVQAPRNWSEYADDALGGVGIKSYGWAEAVYTGVRDFFIRYLRVRLPRLKLSGEICSELVARYSKLKSDSLSPQGLFEELRAAGHVTKLIID